MSDQERVRIIKALECCTQHGRMCGRDCNGHWGWTDGSHTGMELLGEYRTKCLYGNCETGCVKTLAKDALALLKEQEPTTVEPKRIELADETKAWLDKMDAVDALANIANICIDWDGYRTADGLGGLVNEIWAYARYCADRIAKAQEPVEPVFERQFMPDIEIYDCGKCGASLGARGIAKYCMKCGQAVKWDG